MKLSEELDSARNLVFFDYIFGTLELFANDIYASTNIREHMEIKNWSRPGIGNLAKVYSITQNVPL